MTSINVMTAALAAVLLPAMVSASVSGLSDSATTASCTGSTACCIPSCDVHVGDFYGCTGTVAFAGTCSQNYDNPSGTQDVDGCSDVQVTFLRDPDGSPVYDIYHKTDRTYDRYAFSNCQAPSTGGSQCVPSGGGCDTSQILTGAQG